MARSFNGTSQDGLVSTVDLSAFSKLTISFWLYWNSFANNDALAMEFTPNVAANNGGFLIDPNESSTGKFVFRMGNAVISAASFPRPTAGTFHHYLFVLDKTLATNQIVAIYVDGISQSLVYIVNAQSESPFASSNLNIMCRNSGLLLGAGRMAELTLWGGILLNSNEAQALTAGVNARFVRSKPTYYWPMFGLGSSEPELSGNADTMTLVGAPPQANHPSVTLWTRRTAGMPLIQTGGAVVPWPLFQRMVA